MVEMRNSAVKRGIGTSAAGQRDTSPMRQPNGWDGPEVSVQVHCLWLASQQPWLYSSLQGRNKYAGCMLAVP